MTNEEIEKLEAGERLNELIALLVMGETPPYAYADPSVGGGHGDPGGYRIGVRPYSTEIGAAWRVVEKMRALWPVVQLEADVEGWCVEVHTDKGTPSYYRMVADAYAKTAPLAICHAALRAINTEDSTNV